MSTPEFRRDPRITPLPAAEIRRRFVEFFAERGHTVVPSASLVPGGDQTLLFTNSGMVQFKDALTGAEQRSYNRAVDYQRCLRVAGKHNDFEEVGRTPRHHTLFEMLGNFSFGDYFKPEAIRYAWDFLTRDLGIPADRLAATVYSTDDDAYRVWHEEIGLPPERIARWGDFPNGDEKNWWRMADIGPCGPCSEIHYDRGAEFSEGDFCVPDHSEHCPRWLEIWNLVFMQFELHPDRSLTSLPAPGVDTGMGLERLASVIQGVPSNYDTDLFAPIHARMRELLGHDPDAFEAERFSYQVIADHSRAAAFLIGDGVLPSNEGRGYVLRRILRRAVRHGRLLGRREPFMAETAAVVIETMAEAYPHLEERRAEILGAIAREEAQFVRTLEAGTGLLEDALIPLTSNERVVGLRPEDLPSDAPMIPGEIAFKLHDTFGFPIDLTVELAAEYGVGVDRDGFDRALAEQRERSRSGKKAELARHAELSSLYQSIHGRTGDTTFLGYETTTVSDVRVVAILRDGIGYETLEAKGDEELRTEPGAAAEVVLDRTPFYAEGGGQVGDRGVFRDADRTVVFEVEDTQKPVGGLIVHRGTLRGFLAVGQAVVAEVDADRRAHTMRNHTGTHLLHRALRHVVGERARQAGSLVTPDYLRFDYPFDRGLTDDERRAIEDDVRRIIREDRPVSIAFMGMQDAIDAGADAFFDEKYGETVRTIRVEDYSFELCGGTHCRASGQIGGFVITSDRSIGSGMRRIEALTGAGADAYLRSRAEALEAAMSAVGAQTGEAVAARIGALQDELREARRRLKAGAGAGTGGGIPKPAEIAARAVQIAPGVRLAALAAPFDSMDELRRVARDVSGALGSGIVALGLDADEPQVFVTVSAELVARGISAGDLVRAAMAAIDGRGGGRPEMAQGRGARREGLGDALVALEAAAREIASGEATAGEAAR
ncbi:MAG TPA: alanine--tRNA ligase [Candidatus Sulfomarinibacteraceae bacterium]|nr:alanine--tRNA ligase [Candidatus Sulfomarinibacteraceae bacterium]